MWRCSSPLFTGVLEERRKFPNSVPRAEPRPQTHFADIFSSEKASGGSSFYYFSVYEIVMI